MFDFPNAPTNGQQITGPNGVQYVWDGVKWSSGALPNLYAPINNPVFTGDARAVTAAYADNDTSVATTAFVQTATAPNTHNVGRNLLHNAMFNVQQRGQGPWTASGNYTADRWRMLLTGDTVSIGLSALVDADRTTIGDEAAYWRLNNTFTGNAAATANHFLTQPIENVRRLAGKSITISFWAQCIGTPTKLGINLNQSFGSGGSPSAGVWALATGASVTLTNVWTRYSTTIAVPSSTGKTLGTNGDDYTMLALFYSSGANTNAVAGNIGVQSGTVQLWGAQLEIGSVATPLEKLDPRMDIANCQRFFQSSYLYLTAYQTAGAVFATTVYFATAMRAPPTVTIPSPGLLNLPSIAVIGSTANTAIINGTAAASGPTSMTGTVNATADL